MERERETEAMWTRAESRRDGDWREEGAFKTSSAGLDEAEPQ
jgi:hypothetical protein